MGPYKLVMIHLWPFGNAFWRLLITKCLIIHSVYFIQYPSDPPNYLHALHSGCPQLSHLLHGEQHPGSAKWRKAVVWPILAASTNKVLWGASGNHGSNQAAPPHLPSLPTAEEHQRMFSAIRVTALKHTPHPTFQAVWENYLCLKSWLLLSWLL